MNSSNKNKVLTVLAFGGLIFSLSVVKVRSSNHNAPPVVVFAKPKPSPIPCINFATNMPRAYGLCVVDGKEGNCQIPYIRRPGRITNDDQSLMGTCVSDRTGLSLNQK